MSYKGIKPGDKIKFKQYAGRGLKGPEYRDAVAKVNPLLIFDHHVVVNAGGKHGTPQVVDEKNFLGVIRKADVEETRLDRQAYELGERF